METVILHFKQQLSILGLLLAYYYTWKKMHGKTLKNKWNLISPKYPLKTITRGHKHPQVWSIWRPFITHSLPMQQEPKQSKGSSQTVPEVPVTDPPLCHLPSPPTPHPNPLARKTNYWSLRQNNLPEKLSFQGRPLLLQTHLFLQSLSVQGAVWLPWWICSGGDVCYATLRWTKPYWWACLEEATVPRGGENRSGHSLLAFTPPTPAHIFFFLSIFISIFLCPSLSSFLFPSLSVPNHCIIL